MPAGLPDIPMILDNLQLLALEIAPSGREAADRWRAACLDPAHEHCGVHRGSMVNYSSSALRSPSRRWPNTWSSDGDRPARDGAPFCVTMPRKSQPCICSWSRPSGSSCVTNDPWRALPPLCSGLAFRYTQIRDTETNNHLVRSVPRYGAAVCSAKGKSDETYCSSDSSVLSPQMQLFVVPP
jgi:hypothetical protein